MPPTCDSAGLYVTLNKPIAKPQQSVHARHLPLLSPFPPYKLLP